jgi:hypothetical protein
VFVFALALAQKHRATETFQKFLGGVFSLAFASATTLQNRQVLF